MTNPKNPLVVRKNPSTMEKVAGAPATGIAAAVVGAFAGDIAGLLPTLVDSLARGRQMERVEQSIRDLEDGLNAMHEKVVQLTDDQFKVVAESATAMYSTVDPDKLQILRRAALQAVQHPDAVQGVADGLSRALRDLSTSEVHFMIKHREASGIAVAQKETSEQGRIFIKGGTQDEIAMTGLMSLGLLVAAARKWDAQMFEWSPLVPKLIQILRSE